MRFGTFFPHQLPRPWTDTAEAKAFAESLEQVEIADRIGIGYAWGQEHHFLEEYAHSTAPEIFLAAFSQRTKRIRLGHGIVLMPPKYNPPARVAERIATLDLVSGGRVEWGTGESNSRIELEGFGINYVDKRAMWAEAVRETAKMMSMDPYPGYEGRYFSMPVRNVVPKPIQKPHPPLWVACTNRDTMKLAARLGMGALTFAFMDPGEAKFWVDEYYETFKHECTPIGRAVNPNIAMLTGFMCHPDRDLALTRGIEGLEFFKYGLAHYYRFGEHVPGRTSLWDAFKKVPPPPMAGVGGIGTPDDVRENFAKLEAAGVDQLILLHQGGKYQHEHICESLELFGSAVLQDFEERHEQSQRAKAERLAPYIAKALERVPDEPIHDIPTVDAYPILCEKQGVSSALTPKRSVDGAAVWKMHVGGVRPASTAGREETAP